MTTPMTSSWSCQVASRFDYATGDVELGPGELFVVPVGAAHQPVAVEEAELLLIEPTGTPNTGNAATAAQRIEI
jgi:mannose-6-phosphate isomerase-like protein (cupin superfamily)